MDFSRFTPLGRADKLVKQLEGLDEQRLKEYEEAFEDYRRVKLVHLAVRALLYAGIITSITATFGFRVDIIARISSYIGVTVLLIAYTVLSYFVMVYRESFYVRRELLIRSAEE